MPRKSKAKSPEKKHLEAVKTYQTGKSRFIFWFPDALKATIEEELSKKGLTPRKVFEDGLRRAGITVPE
jgi:hypothetical protein